GRLLVRVQLGEQSETPTLRSGGLLDSHPCCHYPTREAESKLQLNMSHMTHRSGSEGKPHLTKRRDHGDTSCARSGLYPLSAKSAVPPPGMGRGALDCACCALLVERPAHTPWHAPSRLPMGRIRGHGRGDRVIYPRVGTTAL